MMMSPVGALNVSSESTLDLPAVQVWLSKVLRKWRCLNNHYLNILEKF